MTYFYLDLFNNNKYIKSRMLDTALAIIRLNILRKLLSFSLVA